MDLVLVVKMTLVAAEAWSFVRGWLITSVSWLLHSGVKFKLLLLYNLLWWFWIIIVFPMSLKLRDYAIALVLVHQRVPLRISSLGWLIFTRQTWVSLIFDQSISFSMRHFPWFDIRSKSQLNFGLIRTIRHSTRGIGLLVLNLLIKVIYGLIDILHKIMDWSEREF